MKLALIGYGKMGKMIEQMAIEKGHSVVAVISTPTASRHMTAASLRDAEVCIDFTHPTHILHNVERVAALKKNLIIGTTGWYDKLDVIQNIIDQYKIGCLYAPNFSIGVNIFLRMVADAANIIDQFDEYDIAGFEAHHNQKADSPSGTGKLIAETLVDKIRRKKSIIYDLGNRKIQQDELHFPSLRCGSTPGTHEVLFDSSDDTISLTHTARNREGFAKGAVAAAEWIKGKEGLYTIQDMINMMVE